MKKNVFILWTVWFLFSPFYAYSFTPSSCVENPEADLGKVRRPVSEFVNDIILAPWVHAQQFNKWRKTPKGAMAMPDWAGFTADWVERVVAFAGPVSRATIEDTTSDFGASPGVAQDFGRVGTIIGTVVLP